MPLPAGTDYWYEIFLIKTVVSFPLWGYLRTLDSEMENFVWGLKLVSNTHKSIIFFHQIFNLSKCFVVKEIQKYYSIP